MPEPINPHPNTPTVLIVIFFPLAAGPHPRRDLSLTHRRGFPVRGHVWPQALLL
jgi:hypothetical protein